jgi:hypothetical protein
MSVGAAQPAGVESIHGGWQAMSTNYRQDDSSNAAVTQSTRMLLDLHDALERLERLEQANGHLRELVQHCSAYWGYSHCGYQQMEPPQRALYDEVIGRTARSQKALSFVAASASADWRSCKFCGCNTNARERVCCQPGRDADRRSWSQPAASTRALFASGGVAPGG